MMVISGVRRKGRSIEITGQLIGAWPSKMYETPMEFAKMILMGIRLGVIIFVALSPLFLLLNLFANRKKK